MKLYEIDSDIRQVLDEITCMMDETGEITDEAVAALSALQEERKKKLEAIAMYCKELKVEAEALDAEAKKLTARAKTASRQIDFFKKYITDSMIMNGEPELKTSRCTLTFRKSERVIVDENLPKAYLVKKIEYTADKKLIKELLKSGKRIRGARIEETQNLQIN